jgi:hypothetical protein
MKIIDGIHNYVTDYKMHRNGATTSTSTGLSFRWPVTRSHARRIAVNDALADLSPGGKAYQWIRVIPPVPPPS